MCTGVTIGTDTPAGSVFVTPIIKKDDLTGVVDEEVVVVIGEEEEEKEEINAGFDSVTTTVNESGEMVTT